MSWYVLVEANKSWSGDNTWELVEKIPIEGGREAALARAEEMSRTYARGVDREKIGRLVFRTSPTSWLVEQTRSVWYEGSGPTTLSEHMRICVAELVLAREPVPADPPKKFWQRR
ncbi:hypothetical protein [Streptomyces bambusae]|uniref:Uncharacterized protein n=1 Tax=Streptomyces bambusae TaxID=1550616 RepID=A0ABS6Z864_9ACTN|nr:hypothetical protein [Streptomyces bambusae]MBW5483609.1 hypothetical protein [Streptomyces bambusae]